VRLEEVQALAERTPPLARTYQERGHETSTRRFRGEIVAYGEPQMGHTLPPTTARPPPWPRTWVCVRSRPMAAAVSACCMP